MRKKLLVLFFIFLFFSLSAICFSACNKNENGISFKTLSVEGNNVYGKVANNVYMFSFLDEIDTKDNANYVVSYDINGNEIIPSKTTNINEGDNIFYVLEKINGKETKLYKVRIRRRPKYLVTFNTNGGTAVERQYIEEDTFATEPTTTRAGYTFVSWDYDFSKAITKNTTITASWKANTNTPYKVEYYLENLEDDNYTLTETVNLTGTTDTQASAEIKTYEHFKPTTNTVKGNINGDGSTVLKVYYKLDRYDIRIIPQNETINISNTYNGRYKYGYNISRIDVASLYLGYDFDGWYNEKGEKTENDYIPAFTVEKDVNFIAKSVVKKEMSIFNFTSDTTSCTITGLKDKTLTKIIIPDCVSDIGENAFNGYNNLEEVVIPDSVTNIGGGAFYLCSGLSKVNIPDSLTSIKNYVFCGCSSLLNIAIPDSVTSIGNYAFAGCERIEEITVPNSVTSVGSFAFGWCDSLTTITASHGLDLTDALQGAPSGVTIIRK